MPGPRRSPALVPRVFELRRGPGVERELAGQDDIYEIDLTAGQFLFASFDQRGVDIVVDVFGPDAGQLLRADRPYDAVGAEKVYLVAETSGRYRLKVKGFDPASRGRYLARVEALRPATSADRRRAAAEKLVSEVRRPPGPGFWEAVAKLEKALRLFTEIGARDRQAESLYWLGKQYLKTRDYHEALGLFQDANALYRQLQDHRFIAVTYNEIGWAYAGMGDFDRARPAYRRAMAHWLMLPLADGHARTLENLGELDALQGKTTEALRFYREAAGLWHRRGLRAERKKEANALTHLAWVYRSVGGWHQALAVLGPALDLCRDADGWQQRAEVLEEFGKIYLDADEPGRALPYLERAFRLETGSGDGETLADIFSNLGFCYQELHEYGRSLLISAAAIKAFHQMGKRQAEAIAWLNLGSAYVGLQQPQRAGGPFGKAMRLAHDSGIRSMEAAALLGAGIAARDRGRLGEALADGEAALKMVEALRGGTSRPDLRALVLALDENHYGFLIEVLMAMHAEQPGRGFDLRALRYSEQERARNLLDDLVARETPSRGSSVEPALLAERQRLAKRIVAADRRLRAPGNLGGPPAASAAEVEDLFERLRDVSDRISQAAAPAQALPPAGSLPRSIVEIPRGLLDDKTMLLEYYLGAAKSYLWAVTPDAVASFELPGTEQLDPLLVSTHELLSHSWQADKQEAAASQALRLSRILLGQVAGRLGERRLLIVANGGLQTIPFAALPDPTNGAEPLMLRHEIVYAPSLAVLAELRAGEQERSRPEGQIAILADPVFGPRDERAAKLHLPDAMLDQQLAKMPRLPYSKTEAETIAALVGRQDVLEALGFDANVDLVTSGRLARYRVLHFATHGTLSTGPAELSALALSQIDRDGHPHEGFLRALDIANLELPADLVVLSACETAMGKQLAGEGLVGLPRAFMSAGARRVLVSLWNVGDRSTAALMDHFYRALLNQKLQPAAALRAAQRAMWQEAQWRAPSYWGGFVLQGDWR
jgi:CHAT domain-containing protein/Flp pilus assembly protein TadD